MISKFRAWLKNDKEMIDVDEIHFDNGQLDFIGDGITFMRKADEIELMQSTGLKDKNGQESFEGDILTDEVWSYVYVIFKDGMWYCMPAKSEGYCGALNEFNEYYSAVGNIYENSDILEDINETL